MPVLIDVYRKAGCQLCDDAVDALDDLQARFDFDVRQHNIQTDAVLFEKYRYLVPVVVIGGIERLSLRFDTHQLEAALNASGVPRRE